MHLITLALKTIDYPNQSLLISTTDDNATDAESEEARDVLMHTALNESLIKALEQYDVQAIIAPMDSPIASVAACSGSSLEPLLRDNC